ncbi:hypothetical protein LCGC14_2862980, partial [marine sediment metagenome]
MKAFIYTRFSPRPQAQNCDSCEKQGDRCFEFGQKKDYKLTNLISVFDDEGISGID